MDSYRRRRLRRRLRCRLRRPHTPSVALAPSSSAGPQRPSIPVSVPPARLRRQPRPRHQCPPGAAPELFRVFCLRCAVHTATDPAATCRFDRPESKKCRYCREQKSLCDPVSVSHHSSSFLYLMFVRFHLPWPPGAKLFSGIVASLGRLLPSLGGKPSVNKLPRPRVHFAARRRPAGGLRPLRGRRMLDRSPPPPAPPPSRFLWFPGLPDLPRLSLGH